MCCNRCNNWNNGCGCNSCNNCNTGCSCRNPFVNYSGCCNNTFVSDTF